MRGEGAAGTEVPATNGRRLDKPLLLAARTSRPLAEATLRRLPYLLLLAPS